MSVGVGGPQGIVAQARAEAQKRSQRLSTAHVLPVLLFRDPMTAHALAAAGLAEAPPFRWRARRLQAVRFWR